MMPCKKCGMLPKDCNCHTKEHKNITGPCQQCGEVIPAKLLKDNQNGMELCGECLTISQMEPSEREYFRATAAANGMQLIDMPLHLQVANMKNMSLEEYLKTLPRNRQQFKEYFKDGITIGGVTL